MQWWWVGLLAVLLVVIGVLALRQSRRKQRVHSAQRRVDQLVSQALQALRWHQAPVAGTPVASVWGHGVLAYAYSIPLPAGSISEVVLQKQLDLVAQQAGLRRLPEAKHVVALLDCYERSARLHLTVALLSNSATLHYAQDMVHIDQVDAKQRAQNE